MTKKEFLKIISEKTNSTLKDAELFYNIIFETIKENIKTEKVLISDFGTFSTVNTKARKGRNPQTGEEIDIPASLKVKFNPSVNLKEFLK